MESTGAPSLSFCLPHPELGDFFLTGSALLLLRVFSPPPGAKSYRESRAATEYGGLVRPQGSVSGGLTRRMQGSWRLSGLT